MKKLSKKITLGVLIFLNIVLIGFNASDEGNGIVIKINSDEDFKIYLTVKYADGDITTVYLAKENNFTDELQIATDKINIESFRVISDEGEISQNYKASGELNDNVFNVNLIKVDDKEPINNELGKLYDSVATNNMSVGGIDINANIPSEFGENITLFFTEENGDNLSYILRYPEYAMSANLKIGKLELQEIEVSDDIGQYEIEAPEEIEISSNEIIKYVINIKRKDIKSVEETVMGKDEEVKDKLDNNKNESDHKDKESSEKSIISKISDMKVTIVIIAILGGVYLIVKSRRECD